MSSRIIGKIEIESQKMAKDLFAISQFPVIEEEYSEFGTGTWLNNSLMNANGDYKNTKYQDSEFPGIRTSLWEKVPYITKLIEDNFNLTYLRMVRTRNLIDGIVIPHKDFVELEHDKSRYVRIFIPLENNNQAFHSDEYNVFQMQKGEIWILNAAIVHAAANFSKESRVFLCLDFQLPENETVESIFLNKNTYCTTHQPLLALRKPISNNEIDERLNKFVDIMSEANLKEIILELSTIHFFYQIGVGKCYDWLIAIAEKIHSNTLIEKVKSLRTYMVSHRTLGERYSF